MKSTCGFILAVLVLAVTCDPTKAGPSRVRRQNGWIWDNEAVPETSSTERPSTPPSQPTQNPNILRQCMKRCPVTHQFNPICGTNRVTYDNEGKLKCAVLCGVDVQVAFLGSCNI